MLYEVITHLETDSTRQAPVLVPKLPDSLRFCGEAVPLQFFDVYESLERELIINSFLHSQTLIWLKKTGRYFPVIEPILAAHHIPDDFKYLAVAESGLSHVVVITSYSIHYTKLYDPTPVERGARDPGRPGGEGQRRPDVPALRAR